MSTLILPKISSNIDIQTYRKLSEKIGKEFNYVACIESALAVMNIKEIARSDEKLVALAVITFYLSSLLKITVMTLVKE